MIIQPPAAQRQLKTVQLTCDLAVIGGGLAGTCCAITAARAGVKVVLIQDRPVLGGNASSEVRLWTLGATSHMGNNNRWAREGGLIDEIFVENTYRNPEGNPLLFDAVLLEKVTSEPNITLLLNTAVFEVAKWLGHPAQESGQAGENSWAGSPSHSDMIKSVRAYCSQNETLYEVSAPLFCDASGDGVVGFQAGAAFRMGAESRDEFGEKFAPDKEYGELLGHSIFFYSKNVGKPVKFIPPAYALTDITKIPRFGSIASSDQGCSFWWLEYGGRCDTIHETEKIKWELWKVVYGVWNHIKNSGKFPEAENLTLEWVGLIPGKRESRRFEGDYILKQQDLIEQRRHADAVAFGGWAIDLHPADGVYSDKPGCTQWHSKGVYQIPYRCLYSRNIKNLFLAGRVISVSHVAFGSTRVMATSGHTAQAVGIAASQGKLPRDVDVVRLQRELLRTGHYIPHLVSEDEQNLVRTAHVEASSSLALAELKPNGETLALDGARAMLVPVAAGAMPRVTLLVDVARSTTLRAELRTSSKSGNFTPDVTLARLEVALQPGKAMPVALDWNKSGTGFQPVSAGNKTLGQDAQATQGVHVHGLEAHATDLNIRQGAYLPHWERTGSTYAVTFRLADSLPQDILESLEAIPRDARAEKIEAWLDAGRGACWLRQDPVTQLVADALRHFDGSRYQLHAWCVMPNHVHAVVTPLGDHQLAEIVHSWKSFTANQANKLLGRTGTFWQAEYFDHLIRNDRDFGNSVEYVLNNPVRAGLRDWQWVGSGTGFQPVREETPDHGQDDRATQRVNSGEKILGQDAQATRIAQPCYVFVCLMANNDVAVHLSDQRVTGVLSLMHGANKKVAKSAVQKPATDVGVDTFEFWIPERRPGGKNLAIAFDPPLAVFAPENVLHGPARPTTQPNAWVAGFDDQAPRLTLSWGKPQTIGRIELSFDTDFDNAMETVQWGHPDRAMPFCVKHYRVKDGQGNVVAECADNHQTRNVIKLEQPITTERLVLECLGTHGGAPAAIMEVRCYEE
jgi:REP element-mobilizing transposase RayT